MFSATCNAALVAPVQTGGSSRAKRLADLSHPRRRGQATTHLRVGVVAPLVFLSALIASTAAYAVPITYTETVTASGSLNSVGFTNANIVLKETSDTTNVVGGGSGSPFFNTGTVTVSVNNGIPVTFTDAAAVSIGSSGIGPFAGFLDRQSGVLILVDINSVFTTYGLTAIGPITGTSVFPPGTPIPTIGGDFILTSAGNPTFTATLETPTVPEPASLALLAIGLAGLGMVRRTRGV